MRRVTTTLLAGAAALALSTTLLAGCGAQGATDGSADAQGDAAAQEEVEPEPEPVMSNWTENSFYERPLPEIASDLELLGFEVSAEGSFEGEGVSGTITYFMPHFQGTPEDNPVEGSSETVDISLTYENPPLQEGETEYTVETIDQEVLPTGVTINFYLPEADSSEFGTVAQSVADAVGLGELTEDYVGDPFGTGRVIGNYTYQDTFKGTELESFLYVGLAPDPESLPDPDMPLMVNYGPYLSEVV